MAFLLDSVFTTCTAFPSEKCGIAEIAPSAGLKPYVRCFWKSDGREYFRAPLRIIPDCCADMIIPQDGGDGVVVGVSDGSFCTRSSGAVFGIRFYAWTLAPFIRARIIDTVNRSVPAADVFKNLRSLQSEIASTCDTALQVEYAERYLYRIFTRGLSSDVMNALYFAAENECRVTVKDMADNVAVGKRTLERRFIDGTGVSPKAMIELMRYQMLWQSCLKCNFSASDSAYRFGYYDDAHMYNDFKKYHGIGLGEARKEYAELSHFYNT